MNAALARFMQPGRQFTAEELKSVCHFCNSTAGQHTGVKGVDREKLDALLKSHGLNLDQFTAAMFTNTLTPERFEVLKQHLAETRELAAAKKAKSGQKATAEDGSDGGKAEKPPAAKPAARSRAQPPPQCAQPPPAAKQTARDKAAAERAEATARRARASTRNPPAPPAAAPLLSFPPAGAGLAPAPSAEATAAIARTLLDPERLVLAAREELQQLFTWKNRTYPELETEGVEAMAVVTKAMDMELFPRGLDMAPSWQQPEAGGSGGGLAPTRSFRGLAPAGSAGARRGLGMAASLEGMMIASRQLDRGAAALENDPDTAALLEAAAAAVPMDGGGLMPALSARTFASGVSWVPDTLFAAPSADGAGLAPASSAETFAQLARATSLLPTLSAEAPASAAAVPDADDGEDVLADARPRLNLFEGLLQSDSFLESFADACRRRRQAAAVSAAAPPPPTFAEAEAEAEELRALVAMLDNTLGKGTVAHTENAVAAPHGEPMGAQEIADTLQVLNRVFSTGLPGAEATWMRS